MFYESCVDTATIRTRGYQPAVDFIKQQFGSYLNPALGDDLNLREPGVPAEPNEAEADQSNQVAALIQNSTLLKSYEQLMQQFEADNDRK